ncbi:hypothetical protein M434DRAFT_392043 [Hypoxylon sp. CO27-5]|nr:hypothetical protein M434DRAFT_392043 [Hypoxylon sp. CO27-5]
MPTIEHEQDTARRTGDAAQPDISGPPGHNSHPKHPSPPSLSPGSGTVSSPSASLLKVSSQSPPNDNTTTNDDINTLPPRPSTPRTRRFQGDFLTLLTLLPAGRYPGPPSPSPLTPGPSPGSMVATSSYSDREERDAEMEENEDISFNNRDGTRGTSSRNGSGDGSGS